MYYLLLVYIGVFIIVGILMILSEVFLSSAEERDPFGENLVDVGCMAVLLAGMVFLASGVASPVLKLIWLYVAPSAAVVQLVLSWAARKREISKAEEAGDDPASKFADYGTLLLMLPALAINLCFALGESVAS